MTCSKELLSESCQNLLKTPSREFVFSKVPFPGLRALTKQLRGRCFTGNN